MTAEIIHESFFGIDTRGQNYGVERIVKVKGKAHVIESTLAAVEQTPDIKVKLDIQIDSSFPRQSRISSSVWTPIGWQQVVTIDGSDPELPKLRPRLIVPHERYVEKVDVLNKIADRLLAASLKVVS